MKSGITNYRITTNIGFILLIIIYLIIFFVIWMYKLPYIYHYLDHSPVIMHSLETYLHANYVYHSWYCDKEMINIDQYSVLYFQTLQICGHHLAVEQH